MVRFKVTRVKLLLTFSSLVRRLAPVKFYKLGVGLVATSQSETLNKNVSDVICHTSTFGVPGIEFHFIADHYVYLEFNLSFLLLFSVGVCWKKTTGRVSTLLKCYLSWQCVRLAL